MAKSKARKVKARPIRKAPVKVAAAAAPPPKPAGVQIVAAAAAALKGAQGYNKPKLSSPMVSVRLTPAIKAALIQLASTSESWQLGSIGKQVKRACRDYVLSPDNRKRLPADLIGAVESNRGRGAYY
jgi:hypothetical protein